jgi:hypothetical protein
MESPVVPASIFSFLVSVVILQCLTGLCLAQVFAASSFGDTQPVVSVRLYPLKHVYPFTVIKTPGMSLGNDKLRVVATNDTVYE